MFYFYNKILLNIKTKLENVMKIFLNIFYLVIIAAAGTTAWSGSYGEEGLNKEQKEVVKAYNNAVDLQKKVKEEKNANARIKRVNQYTDAVQNLEKRCKKAECSPNDDHYDSDFCTDHCHFNKRGEPIVKSEEKESSSAAAG